MSDFLSFPEACVLLSAEITNQAREIAKVREGGGFYVCPAEVAPSSLDAVLRAYTVPGPFPVSSEGLAGSIYGDPMTNAAFRFVHDSLHATCCYGFDLTGELAAAEHHVRLTAGRLLLDGYGPRAVFSVCLLLWLDTAGQAQHYADNDGAFLDDQLGTIASWYYDLSKVQGDVSSQFFQIMAGVLNNDR